MSASRMIYEAPCSCASRMSRIEARLTRRSVSVVWPGNASGRDDGDGGLPGSELPPMERATGAVPEMLPARQPLNLATAFCRLPAEPLGAKAPAPIADSGTDAAVCIAGIDADDGAAASAHSRHGCSESTATRQMQHPAMV